MPGIPRKNKGTTQLLIREIISDEKLPQMETLLNPSQMRDVFERELTAARGNAASLRIDDCRIAYAKYRPGKNLLVAYRLKLVDLETGQTGQTGQTGHARQTVRTREQLISILACPEEESGELFARAKEAPLADTVFGLGVFHVQALEAVGWVFPNDRKLTGLPALIDSDALKNRFNPEIAARIFGDAWSVVGLEGNTVHYVPGRGCTVRVKVDLLSAVSGESQSCVLFGKTYSLAEGESAWRKMRSLWNGDEKRAGRLLIPEPLAYDAEIKTLWRRGLEGETLYEVDANEARYYELLASAGSAVAELHGTTISSAPPVTASEIVSKLEMSADLLYSIRPSCRDELRTLIEKLIGVSERIGTGSIATLHGDLHLKNLLVTNGRIALLDLDNLSLGDPLLDLGSFVASLHYRGVIEGKPLNVIESVSQRFVQAYRAHAAWEVSEWELDWHIAAALIYERAYRCVTRLKVDRIEVLDEIVALSRMYSLRVWDKARSSK